MLQIQKMKSAQASVTYLWLETHIEHSVSFVEYDIRNSTHVSYST